MKSAFNQVDRIMDGIQSKEPGIYAASVPRRIVTPNGYVNPRIYGSFLAATIFASRKPAAENFTSFASGTLVLASQMFKYGVPTYFLGEDFLRAVAATSPPEQTLIGDLKWPLPAMLFALPLAFSKEYTGFGAATPFIAIAHAPPGPYTVFDGISGVTVTDEARMVIHSQAYYGQLPIDYSNVTRASHAINAAQFADFTAWDTERAEMLRKVENGLGDYIEMQTKAPGKEIETQVANRLNSLAVKILMAMSARPELIEEGALLRPSKIKHGREREALWSPNMVGRSYRIVRPPDYRPEGSHASPRMHWRRGHMRWQKFGHGRSQSKIIWIDPMLVNSAPEDEPKPTTA